MTVSLPNLLVTERFYRNYLSASPPLKRLLEGAVHDLVRLCRAQPEVWLRRYDRVAGPAGEQVRKLGYSLLEGKHSDGDRFLVAWKAPKAVLADVGGHEIVERSRNVDWPKALANPNAAPSVLYPESPNQLFVRKRAPNMQRYASELEPEWVYELDKDQHTALDQLRAHLEDVLLQDGIGRHLVIITGGPGTGKTSVLINLADYALNEGFTCAFQASPTIVEYLRQSTADAIDWGALINHGHEASRVDVTLIDDPESLDVIPTLQRTKGAPPRSLVVVAFDPLQLMESTTDAQLDSLYRRADLPPVELRTCYRQRTNVGRAAKGVADQIAQSTPFLDSGKIRKHRDERSRVTRLANDLHYVSPGGYVEVFEQATVGDFSQEIERIVRDRRVWNHWPSLLMVKDDGLPLILPNPSPLKSDTISFSQAHMVKGVEYPHVFLFLRAETYSELRDGFSGSGQRQYAARRLLRIPFSRARESLVTFVVTSGIDFRRGDSTR